MMADSYDNAPSRGAHPPLSTSGPDRCALMVSSDFSGPLPGRGFLTSISEGVALLRAPYFNKGSAFSADERKVFKLGGLLPSNVQTLDEQVKRAFQQYKSRDDPLARNTFMTSMKEQNEVLYYRVRTASDASESRFYGH